MVTTSLYRARGMAHPAQHRRQKPDPGSPGPGRPDHEETAMKKIPRAGESIARMTEDDVEGHKLVVPSATGGESIARMTEDDVEGHKLVVPSATGGESIARMTEDDVEGHKLVVPSATGGESIARMTEDDVEGHNIGYGSPTLARAVYRDREREIQREVSHNSLLRDAKLVNKKRKG